MAVPAGLIVPFFYGLFHNTVTIWDYIALNDGMIGEWWIAKGVTGIGHAICQSYPGIHLKLLSIIKEHLQVIRFLQQCSRRLCSSGILGHVSWMGPNISRQPNVLFKPQRWNYVALKLLDLITHCHDFISQKNRILKEILSLKLVSQLRLKRRTSQMHVEKPYCLSQFAKR